MAMTPPRVSPGHTPLGTPSHTPLANTPPGHTPAQRLKQTGASILAGAAGMLSGRLLVELCCKKILHFFFHSCDLEWNPWQIGLIEVGVFHFRLKACPIHG